MKVIAFIVPFFIYRLILSENYTVVKDCFDQLKISLKKKWREDKNERIGAGISGGPDSMVLLSVLIEVCKDLKLPLYVLTVDHNIRSGGESAADADLVLDYCHKNKMFFDIDLVCEKTVLEKGRIKKTADNRRRGIEESARFLRYSLFEQFIKRYSIDCFCLGHNRNDQLETLIQRFLQGSALPSLAGIQSERGCFYRPLLHISRSYITEYANMQQIPYRIDATNLETAYYRNRIRNKLIPCLDYMFPGWDTGVLHGAEKAADFGETLQSVSDSFVWNEVSSNILEMDENVFDSLDIAVRITLLYKALNKLAYSGRVRYSLLKEVALGENLVLSGLSFRRKNGQMTVSTAKEKNQEKSGFSFVLTGNDSFELSDELMCTVSTIPQERSVGSFVLPFMLRSVQCADNVECADGTFKLLTKIFSDWKVPESLRCKIPVLEESGKICAVFGKCYGYKDWIVRKIKPDDSSLHTGEVFVAFQSEMPEW